MLGASSQTSIAGFGGSCTEPVGIGKKTTQRPDAREVEDSDTGNAAHRIEGDSLIALLVVNNHNFSEIE